MPLIRTRICKVVRSAPRNYTKCRIRQSGCAIWYGLVYSPAGKRLAYGALSLALALGFYVIAAEHTEQRPVLAQPAMAAAQSANPEVFGAAGAPAEQRDAVLVNLASYGNTATVSETNQP